MNNIRLEYFKFFIYKKKQHSFFNITKFSADIGPLRKVKILSQNKKEEGMLYLHILFYIYVLFSVMLLEV